MGCSASVPALRRFVPEGAFLRVQLWPSDSLVWIEPSAVAGDQSVYGVLDGARVVYPAADVRGPLAVKVLWVVP